MEVIERAEIAQEVAPKRDTPYIAVMKVWASWITLKNVRESGLGLSHPQDAKEFMRTGEAVDVMINNLPRFPRWAINKAWGTAPAVWRFPEISFPDALAIAEKTIEPKMRENVDTRRYFN